MPQVVVNAKKQRKSTKGDIWSEALREDLTDSGHIWAETWLRGLGGGEGSEQMNVQMYAFQEEGSASTKGPNWERCASILKEYQEGQCGWSRVSGREQEMRSEREWAGGKEYSSSQTILCAWVFTLNDMGAIARV